MDKLLTRDEFRRLCLNRDDDKCIVCKVPATEVHHLLERRLWGESGGYFLNNGVSLCNECHQVCEMTLISVELLRKLAGIEKIILPDHLYDDQNYDKWGNIIIENGRRLRGELYFDESVQKILARGDVLGLFIPYVKYPRTYHLPWSESMTKDDRMMKSVEIFRHNSVVVTEKMDGENTTLYRDHFHARSIDSCDHPSQHWVKHFWGSIRHEIPYGWRVCGENMYAKHSIYYTDLPSLFLGFSVWDDRNRCLPWDETLEWFALLGITPVREIYRGIFDEDLIRSLWIGMSSPGDCDSEGYVIRAASSIPYGDFRRLVGKYVRKNHVATVPHWRYGQRLEQNLLKGAKHEDRG